MVVIHVVVMRLGLGIKVSRIRTVIRHVELVRVVLIVGVLSGGGLAVVNLILRKLHRPRVDIVGRDFVISVDFDHVVMLEIVCLVLLGVELRRELLGCVWQTSLLMELDLVLGEQGVADLEGQVWRRRTMLRIESLEVAVLDVPWLPLDLQLVLILIVGIPAIGVAFGTDEMRRLNIFLAIHFISVEIRGLCDFLFDLKKRRKLVSMPVQPTAPRNLPFSYEFLLSS